MVSQNFKVQIVPTSDDPELKILASTSQFRNMEVILTQAVLRKLEIEDSGVNGNLYPYMASYLYDVEWATQNSTRLQSLINIICGALIWQQELGGFNLASIDEEKRNKVASISKEGQAPGHSDNAITPGLIKFFNFNIPIDIGPGPLLEETQAPPKPDPS
jgi:hypothetical protein